MKTYTKPNMELPFSLHDSRATNMIVQLSTTELMDGMLIVEFDDGYFRSDENNTFKTGKASITIAGIDFDFSQVYYCRKGRRESVDFYKLKEDVKKYGLEIIDETYGYNQTKLSCNMNYDNEDIEVEIEIYHFKKTIYQWD